MAAQFRVFGPKPLPCLALSNAGPPCRRHLIHTPLPPHPITHHRHFQRRARNRAVALAFVALVPNPLPSPRTSNRTGTPQPTPPLHHPTPLSPHPPLPFYTACTKPSHNGSFRERTTPPPPPPDTHYPTT